MLVLATIQLLDFNRNPIEFLGILPQFPIMVGGNNFLIDMVVVDGPLVLNMLLGCDNVYSMNVVISTLFLVMHFPSR
jgi:hypothetical protein